MGKTFASTCEIDPANCKHPKWGNAYDCKGWSWSVGDGMAGKKRKICSFKKNFKIIKGTGYHKETYGSFSYNLGTVIGCIDKEYICTQYGWIPAKTKKK